MAYCINPETLRRVRLLAVQASTFAQNPRSIPKDDREFFAMMVAATFHDFRDFAYLGMRYLGFYLTDMQADIAYYMQHGPRKSMVSAQRGEAKSTLAALFAVWELIQRPTSRVMVVSAAGKQASQVASLPINMIETWDLLCYLRPDKLLKDRTSLESYDVHRHLKGLDKSPSITCQGITSNLAGFRADLLIPDDIESTKNGLTQTQREQIELLSKEFGAICIKGKILYLGTPQTKDSMYRRLPSRGYSVRIWPGRVPSKELLESYGDTIAPYILDLIENGAVSTGYGLTGTLGEPTDPEHITEAILCEKEDEYGPEGFHLQYMLDTSLADALRTKIKLSDMVVFAGDSSLTPSQFVWMADQKYRIDDHPACFGVRMFRAAHTAEPLIPYMHKCMVIDPAGCGGDEVSYAIGGAASSYIHLFSTGGFQGGISTENIDKLIDICVEFDTRHMVVESNMGHGTVSMLIMNRLIERKIYGIAVEDLNNSVQKERRIIDSISPVTRRHRLVVHQRAILDDIKCCEKYPQNKRWLYSAFQQMSSITYDRNSLSKDDRADSIAMLVQQLNGHLVQDQKVAAEKAVEEAARAFMDNPMGYTKTQLKVSPRASGTRARLLH